MSAAGRRGIGLGLGSHSVIRATCSLVIARQCQCHLIACLLSASKQLARGTPALFDRPALWDQLSFPTTCYRRQRTLRMARAHTEARIVVCLYS